MYLALFINIRTPSAQRQVFLRFSPNIPEFCYSHQKQLSNSIVTVISFKKQNTTRIGTGIRALNLFAMLQPVILKVGNYFLSSGVSGRNNLKTNILSTHKDKQQFDSSLRLSVLLGNAKGVLMTQNL